VHVEQDRGGETMGRGGGPVWRRRGAEVAWSTSDSAVGAHAAFGRWPMAVPSTRQTRTFLD
jgi:hypothetical protein